MHLPDLLIAGKLMAFTLFHWLLNMRVITPSVFPGGRHFVVSFLDRLHQALAIFVKLVALVLYYRIRSGTFNLT